MEIGLSPKLRKIQLKTELHKLFVQPTAVGQSSTVDLALIGAISAYFY